MRSSGVPSRTASTHVADGGPDLVVGVGRGDDLRARRGDRQRRRPLGAAGGRAPRQCQRAADPRVGVGAARSGPPRPWWAAGAASGGEQLRPGGAAGPGGGGRRRAPSSAARRRRRGADDADGRVGEVGLVVPAVGQQRAGAAAQAHDVVRAPPGAPRARPGRRAERSDSSAYVATSAARWRGARPPGRTCRARRPSTRRRAAAITGVDTGRRPAAARGRRPEQLGQAVGGEERDGGDARAARCPASPSAPPASSRRAVTPTWLEGTTTVTGASGSPALAAATAVAQRLRARGGRRGWAGPRRARRPGYARGVTLGRIRARHDPGQRLAGPCLGRRHRHRVAALEVAVALRRRLAGGRVAARATASPAALGLYGRFRRGRLGHRAAAVRLQRHLALDVGHLDLDRDRAVVLLVAHDVERRGVDDEPGRRSPARRGWRTRPRATRTAPTTS